ncbi:hypothetical protein BDN72DRAFT_839629, partial [Pluteus cervinus]
MRSKPSSSWPDLELGSTSHAPVDEPPPVYHATPQADRDTDSSDGEANEIQTLLKTQDQPETSESNLADPHEHAHAQASDSDSQGVGDHRTTGNKTGTPASFCEIVQPFITVISWLFPLFLYGILWLYILNVNDGDLQLKSQYSNTSTTNSTGTNFESNATHFNATNMTNTTTMMDPSSETIHTGYWLSWFFAYLFNAGLILGIVDFQFQTRQGKVSAPVFFLTLQTAVIPVLYIIQWHHERSTNPNSNH